MKAPAFAYLRAASLEEAFSALDRHGDGAKLLAGGQSLVPALNLRLLAPEILIDINGVAELRGIEVRGDRLRIGALTRHAEIERSDVVRTHAPLLTDAVRHVAHPAIRTRGTFGGSLAHADPASEFPACAVALGAEIVVASQGGERRIAAEDFVTGLYETALRPDEILVAVEIRRAAVDVMAGLDPAIPIGDAPSSSARDHRDESGDDRRVGEPRHVFLELARRLGDYALVGLACTALAEGDLLRALRPVFFAAGPRPILARAAAAELEGRPVDEASIARACEALASELEPEADLQISAATRLHLARTLLRRAVPRLLDDTADRMRAAA